MTYSVAVIGAGNIAAGFDKPGDAHSPGGEFVSLIAYRTDYIQARAEQEMVVKVSALETRRASRCDRNFRKGDQEHEGRSVRASGMGRKPRR